MKQTTKNAFIAISVMKKVMLTAILLFNTSCGNTGLDFQAGENEQNITCQKEGVKSPSSIKSAASMTVKAFTWSYKSSGVVTSFCTKAVTSTYGWLFGDSNGHNESSVASYTEEGDGPVIPEGLISKEQHGKNLKLARKNRKEKEEKERRSAEISKIEVVETPHKVVSSTTANSGDIFGVKDDLEKIDKLLENAESHNPFSCEENLDTNNEELSSTRPHTNSNSSIDSTSTQGSGIYTRKLTGTSRDAKIKETESLLKELLLEK